MKKEMKNLIKHLELKKILLAIFFVGITILFELIYEIIFSKKMSPSSDVFPSWITYLDISVLLQINPALTNPSFSIFFNLITYMGRPLTVIIIFLIFHLLDYKKEAILILTSFLIGTIAVFLLKEFIPRPRPYITLYTVIPFEKEIGTSFPSGHSERIFALTAVLSRKKSKKILFLYFLAFLIAFSRVYLGVHYPLDVFVGSIIGWVIGKLTLRQEDKILKVASKFFSLRYSPQMNSRGLNT